MRYLSSYNIPSKIRSLQGSRRGGYTLLFAVLTATLVLGVAVFILSVSRKQYILATTARESTFAIYAAYSGIECAAYAYSIGDLATSTGAGVPQSAKISCNSSGVKKTSSWRSITSAGRSESGLVSGYELQNKLLFFFPFTASSAQGECVSVGVFDGLDTAGDHKTIIIGRGYNLGTATECPINSPRSVERALRLTYE